jgi:hypothetical protein
MDTTAADLEAKFAAANPRFPKGAFRASYPHLREQGSLAARLRAEHRAVRNARGIAAAGSMTACAGGGSGRALAER